MTNQDSKRKCSHGMLWNNKNICAHRSTCTEVTILCFANMCIAGLIAFSKTSAKSQLYRKECCCIRRISQANNSGRTDQGDRQLAATLASCHHPAPRLPVPLLGTSLSKKMKLFSKCYRSTPPKCRYHRCTLYKANHWARYNSACVTLVATLQHEMGNKVPHRSVSTIYDLGEYAFV